MNTYDEITQTIIAYLECEIAKKTPQPLWQCLTLQPKRHDGTPYTGVNTLLLAIAANKQGYSNPYWLTYKQASTMDTCVKKGEKGTKIVFFSVFEKENKDEDIDKIPFLKQYTVFNAEQLASLPAAFEVKLKNTNTVDTISHVEQFVSNTKATINTGNKAFYRSSDDSITMPSINSFDNAQDYYAVLLHELTHWTGHKSRCNRPMKGRKELEAYAYEELIAELGAAFLCSDLEINQIVRPCHASYINSWLKALKNDNRLIFTAASAASKASAFLHNLQEKQKLRKTA